MKKLSKIFVALALVVCALFAVACTPKDIGGAVEKLIEDDYGVVVMRNNCDYIPDGTFDDIEVEGDFNLIVATKETAHDSRIIIVFMFDKKKDAKNLFDDIEDDLEDYAKEERIKYERKGKLIIIAHESAYDDFTE